MCPAVGTTCPITLSRERSEPERAPRPQINVFAIHASEIVREVRVAQGRKEAKNNRNGLRPLCMTTGTDRYIYRGA